MTEEIKEILDNIFKDENVNGFILSDERYKELKDYITNLQQENERLKAIAEEHKNCTRKHWQEKCGEHHTKELIYKSRCEKAIEYIEKEHEWIKNIGYKLLKTEDLLNILNGGDENGN